MGPVDRQDNDDEQFKGADNITQSVVREVAVQNPTGAALNVTQNSSVQVLTANKEPVRLRYFMSGPDRAVSKNVALKYFGGLKPHLDICSRKSRIYPHVLDGNCQYLLIEDFNTSGLTGDIAEDFELEGSGNNFYGLFRSAGKSSKTKGGGSWGVGKLVANMASSIGIFVGYSVRHCSVGQTDATPRVLMGRGTLTTHKLDGKRYSPDAFLSNWSEGYPMAITNSELLDTFVSDWKISRLPSQSGLTTLIPYCAENTQANPVAHVFYLAAEAYGNIMAGLLVIDVDVPGISQQLNRETLEIFVEQMSVNDNEFDWQQLLKKIRLVKWAMSTDSSPNTINLPKVSNPSDVTEYMKNLSKELKDIIYKTFSESGRVSLHIPVTVEHAPDSNSSNFYDGNLKVVLEKDPSSSEAMYPEYFRDWIRIGVGFRNRKKGERPMGSKISQIRSIVLAINGPVNGLSQLLRASEGIAHTKWDPETKGFKEWRKGDVWIYFSKHAPIELADIARGLTNERDYTTFPFFQDPSINGTLQPQPT